jgi:KDO2-lipid IV(A) lauroyltransferase
MDLQELLNSRQGGKIALGLARIIPPGIGYRFSRVLADWIASRTDLPIVRATRANQWVVSGRTLSAQQLDLAVQDTLRYTAKSMFTLFHCWNNYPALQHMIEFSPRAKYLLENKTKKKEGAVVVSVHLSYFDLVMQAVAAQGLRLMVLSLPQTDEAIEWQHDFRRNSGIEILPASISNLRKAITRLQEGGLVLTGIDRPMPELKYTPQFFGYPASLPTHHVYLALKAKVPVVVVSAIMGSDGICRILASDPVEMERRADRRTEIVYNAEVILKLAEGYINQAPQQWSMFHPVWPEFLNDVP